GYYGSAYRSPENWTTALRSSHFSAAARRGIISDRFVEAILRLSHFHKE
ncbi:sialate O-acetylesterase, partial [Escherichia coli]|nr:sialate O-acetylesterase [Escherichia coli]